MANRREVRAGDEYFRWTIVEEVQPKVYPNRQKQRRVRCRCSCGTERVIALGNLISGGSKSCGCWKSEATTARNYVHGQSPRNNMTVEYNSWYAMLRRASANPKSRQYSDYGGRGIEVCERWHTAANFLEDMGQKPSPEYTLERIDNNGNYCPENCRWATRKDQARNRRGLRTVTINGVTKLLVDWCEENGIPAQTAHVRIYRGWKDEHAVTVPLRGGNPCLK